MIIAIAVVFTAINIFLLSEKVWNNRVIDKTVQGYPVRRADLNRLTSGNREQKIIHYQAVAIAKKETNTADRDVYFPQYFQDCCKHKITNNNQMVLALEDAVIIGYYQTLSPDEFQRLGDKYHISHLEQKFSDEVVRAKQRKN